MVSQCYHQVRSLNLCAVGPPAKKARKTKLPTCVVLDIEGTVAPISFVADVLFPYARQHVRAFLQVNVEDPDTLAAVDLLRQQAAEVRRFSTPVRATFFCLCFSTSLLSEPLRFRVSRLRRCVAFQPCAFDMLCCLFLNRSAVNRL